MLFQQNFYAVNQITAKHIKSAILLDSLSDRGDVFYYIKEAENNTFLRLWEELP